MYMSHNEASKKIAVVDNTEKFGTALVKMNKDLYYVTKSDTKKLEDSLRNELSDGYLVINNDFIESGKALVYTIGGGGISFKEKIEENLDNLRRKEIISNSGIDTTIYNKIQSGVSVNEVSISKEVGGKSENGSSEFYAIIGYVVGFFIYMMMLMYGSMVMRGVIEEKANRIIEVLASSAKPFEIMFGKVVGIGLVGLTQMTFWIAMSAILFAFSGPIFQLFNPQEAMMSQMGNMNSIPGLPGGFHIPSISIWVIFAIIFFFLAGYFIYSTLFAAVGSAVDQEQDAAQLQTPISMLILIPFLFMSAVISNPNGTMSTVLSLIPLFSPMLMLARIVVTDGQLPFWQVAFSIVASLLTFIGCVWASSKIYRTGILMYGKKPTIKDLIKWLRLAR
jgi:ABC-2 type transport system permease protein